MANLQFDQALNLFSQSLANSGKSVNTIVAYKGDISQLIKYFQADLNGVQSSWPSQSRQALQ